MFGTFPALANPPTQIKHDPKDIPPPTPVNLPRYQPSAKDDELLEPQDALVTILAQVGRASNALGPVGLSAIGLDLKVDAKIDHIVPNSSQLPDFVRWQSLTAEEADGQNQASRRPIRNGTLSPGCQIYLERKRELSHKNEDAFRTVRRCSPPKGKQQARLGNAYEFFRCLELLTTYWDDPTSIPQTSPSPRLSVLEDTSTGVPDQPQDAASTRSDLSATARTSSGQLMPLEFRQRLVAAFVKLVAYDFGCNVSMSRVEPRLHINNAQVCRSPKTYTTSSCHFIYQSPTTREAARASIINGPVAAVSVRSTLAFEMPDPETAQSLDLAREVTAALITAQHRARQDKTEVRFGDGQWWTSRPRWGGGPGGPIGRELDKHAVQGDKYSGPRSVGDPLLATPKKIRKAMSIFDNYRMVRPPASNWDRKTKYEAIGKVEGTDYDDVFVVSSLFHHVSFLRIRVPLRLLEVLDGAPDTNPSRRSWGKVQAWRSSWYDLFHIEQRVDAMQMLWAIMTYQMRQTVIDQGLTKTAKQTA